MTASQFDLALQVTGAFPQTGLKVSGASVNALALKPNETLSADRILNLIINDANRTINLAGDLTLAGAFSTAGAFAMMLRATAATDITLPTTGTLATLAGSETLTNKTIGNTNTITCKAGTNFTLQDSTTVSKQLQFNLSGITASQTRILTVPNISSTIAVLGLAQTFSATQTFNNGIIAEGVGVFCNTGGLTLNNYIDSASTGSNVEVDNTGSKDYSQREFTNASLVSIKGVQLANAGLLFYINNTGNSITIVDNASVGGTVTKILTGYGANITVQNGGSVILSYNNNTGALAVVGGNYQIPVSSLSGLGTGIATFLATPSSANLAAAITDETGSGALVFANSPALITPSLGVATGTSFNGLTGAGTKSDQETATSTTTYVSPARQQYHPSAVKAYGLITFSGGTPSLQSGSYNITSITDDGTGATSLNLTNAITSNEISVGATQVGSATLATPILTGTGGTSVQITCRNTSGTLTDNNFTAIVCGKIV